MVLSVRPQCHLPLLEWGGAKPLTSIYIGLSVMKLFKFNVLTFQCTNIELILFQHFFFLVQDYGSWLEIGTSISHYVIVMSMICFLYILLFVSRAFTNFRINLFRGKKTHLT